MRQSKLKNTLIALSAIIATEAVASNGTVMSGYGIKNITMGVLVPPCRSTLLQPQTTQQAWQRSGLG